MNGSSQLGFPAIFVPFFLVHDRLRALERTMMLEVEGGTPEWFMKLMRHEAGHAYMYAYQLTRRKKMEEMFRRTSRTSGLTLRHTAVSMSFILEGWVWRESIRRGLPETFLPFFPTRQLISVHVSVPRFMSH